MHRIELADCCVDLDGVLCVDPADDENDDGPRYARFLQNARPLIIPSYPIGHIVTSRLQKYRLETEEWLRDHGVVFGQLHMLDFPSAEIRRRLRPHARFKASVYMSQRATHLFIESEPNQAAEIAQISGKPVLCYGTQQLLLPGFSWSTIRATGALESQQVLRSDFPSRQALDPELTLVSVSVSSAAGWAGASQAGRTALQFATTVILARLLAPGDYGLMAMALAISALGAVFRDLGTGTAIIQRTGLDDRVINGIFRLNLALGLALSILCIAGAGPFAQLLGEPRLAAVLVLMSPIFLVSSVGVVPQALLERESRFKDLAGIELAAAALAASVAVAAAALGLGLYALVAQTLTTITASSVLLFLRSRWRPRRGGSISDVRPLLTFSSNLFTFNSLNYVHRNADAFLVGRFLGAVDLGFYSVGYKVVLFPLQNFTFVLARVLLPAYSRQQSNPAEVSRHYLHSLGSITFISAPLMALIWAVREPFVEALLGPQWLRAAGVIAWLAPVGLLQSMVSTSGSVLSAFGRTDLLRNLGLAGVPDARRLVRSRPAVGH